MIPFLKDLFLNETKRSILFLVISGISLLISFLEPENAAFDSAWIAIVLCGIPIIIEAVEGLVTRFDIKADVLVSLALIASVIIGEIFAAGEVAFIMQIGSLLEELTVAKARAGIEKLVHLTPLTARKIQNEKEEIIPAREVAVGDLLRVLPGETIPVDGVILSGETSVNQAVMTGESLPVDKGPGDEVSSGTVNQFGSFDMKASRVGEDSSIQRMIRLVRSADAEKAKIVRLADRWATWIVVIALTAAALTWLISGEIIRSVTILVVFCPCALVLATPTAIMAAIGNATKHGFLVREGDALERLAQVSKVAFDKTGTLTYGKPQVAAIENFAPDISKENLYRLAAETELRSEHPLGKAVVQGYKKAYPENAPQMPDSFSMLPGKGVQAVINQIHVLAGNISLLEENGISIPEKAMKQAASYIQKGCTLIYLGIEKGFGGFAALWDTLRETAPEMISQLKKLGLTPVLMTGDHENAARAIAGQLNIDNIHAGCLPEDKLNYIASSQENKKMVCMIGDGINDAPALKKAHVSIAMGGVGSDIAVDAADIALVNDDIKELPHLVSLSRRMMTTIKCNLTFSMTLNFIAIILAITGILNPVVGALVHNAGSVLVIINSSLLLTYKRKQF